MPTAYIVPASAPATRRRPARPKPGAPIASPNSRRCFAKPSSSRRRTSRRLPASDRRTRPSAAAEPAPGNREYQAAASRCPPRNPTPPAVQHPAAEAAAAVAVGQAAGSRPTRSPSSSRARSSPWIPGWPTATAVAVKDGRILSVGTLEDLQPWLKRFPYEIDKRFEDQVIYPGFVEAHGHPVMGSVAISLPPLTFFPLRNPYGPDFPGREDPRRRRCSRSRKYVKASAKPGTRRS